MTTEETRNIELGPNDACLILREDGRVENLIPEFDDDAPVPTNVLLSVACAVAVMDLEMSTILIDNLNMVPINPGEEKIPVD